MSEREIQIGIRNQVESEKNVKSENRSILNSIEYFLYILISNLSMKRLMYVSFI